MRNNINNPRFPEYWLKRGYDEASALKLVSNAQTRDLNFFIQKYGEKDGYMRWKNKVDSWKTSFNNNDLNEMNEKRKLNAHVGLYNENTIKNIDKLNFYLILFQDYDNRYCIKYGLTKHENLHKRWSLSLNYTTLFFDLLSADKALKIENLFNSRFKKSHISKKIKSQEVALFTEQNIQICFDILKENECL